MRAFSRVAIALALLQWTIALHAQNTTFKPEVLQRLDQAAQFNGKDRPYILLRVLELLGGVGRPQGRIEPTIGTARDTYEIVDTTSGKSFQPAEVHTLAGGIALFGNYTAGVTYQVKILRDIPCFDSSTGERLGQIQAGMAGMIAWTLKGDAGLDRQRRFEFIPANLTNTRPTGRASSFLFDFNVGYTDYIGEKGNSYIDFSADGNIAPETQLSFNQIEGHGNFGYRLPSRSARFELTNKFQSTQNADKIDYVIGGQAVFLPALAVSRFSKRFAWNPTITFGYDWPKEVKNSPGGTRTSPRRATYGIHCVVPIGDVFAFSVEGTGDIDLIRPVTTKRWHDKTTAGLFVLVHEKDQTKVQTVFKYMRGEAPPAFTFNQSVVLGLLLQLR